jgi:CDP-6-deoxy-D-xylo-4-hexulose-3-dehydrase
MVFQQLSLSGAINIMTKNYLWPLMHDAILQEDKDRLIEFLNTPNVRLTNGEKVKEFEKAWSSWLGVKHSLFVNSGASANDLTMMALYEIHGPGEIIVPPLTWVSDISSVIRAGFTPVFVDIDPKTLALDSDSTIKAINSKTKAVFLTHILGLNGLTTELIAYLQQEKIILIEDVCESHGATFEDKKVGTFGLASNFSFYFAHHMTTIEGGMISTNDDQIYDVLKMMRSHGLVRESFLKSTKDRYASEYPDLNEDFIFAYNSHNMRSTEINAVLGLSQLQRLDSYVDKRRKNYELFMKNISPEIFVNDLQLSGNSNYALTIILKQKSMDIRERVEQALQNKKIEYRRGMAGGGNQLRQPYLRRIKNIPSPEKFENTDHLHFYSWYVGNNPSVNEMDVLDLCDALNEVAR